MNAMDGEIQAGKSDSGYGEYRLHCGRSPCSARSPGRQVHPRSWSVQGTRSTAMRPTGGTNQRLLVPVCRDQDERLRRPVFLHSPTSHGRPFQAGHGGTELANPTLRECTRKFGTAQSSAHLPRKDPMYRLGACRHIYVQCFSLAAAASAEAQKRPRYPDRGRSGEKDVYRFSPCPGDRPCRRRPAFQGGERFAP